MLEHSSNAIVDQSPNQNLPTFDNKMLVFCCCIIMFIKKINDFDDVASCFKIDKNFIF